VITSGGGSLKGYVNGVLENTVAFTTAGISSGLAIGGPTGGQIFNGLIDDVRIYNRALSAQEIANLYTTTAPGITTASTTLNSNLTVNGDLTINSGTLNTSGTNYGVSVKGSWWNNGGVFTPNSSTVTLNGTAPGKNLLSGGQSFYNLTLNGSSGYWTQNQNVTTTNNLTITAGTLDSSTQNYGLTVGGNYTNSSVYVPRNGTVTLNATSTGKTITQGNSAFYNLAVNGVGGGWTAQDRQTITNNFTLTNGTYTAPTTTLNVGGAFTRNGGTFTHNNGSVILSPTANQTLTCTDPFNNLTLNDGLVGYWSFDNGSGLSATDKSGYGNNGTLTNGPTWSSSVPPAITFTNPYALDFDGVDDYVDVGIPGVIKFDNQHTISMWVRANSLNTFNTLISQNINTYNFLVDGASSNNIRLIINGSNALVATTGTFSINTWYHVVVVFDGTGGKLYQNAVQMDSKTFSAPSGLTDNIWIARRKNGGGDIPFPGLIDDIRIYNRALTPTEISTLYAGGISSHPATETLGSAITVNGNLTLVNQTLDTSFGNNYGVSVGGNWQNDGGTFTPRNGTVTFDKTSGTQTITTNAIAFNNVIFNDGGGSATFTFTDAFDVNGNLTITAGTFNSNGQNITLGGSSTVSNDGIFRLQGGETLTNFTNDTDSGTVEYVGTSTYASLKAGLNYYHLTFNGSGGNWTTTGTLDVNGNLTITAGTFNSNGQNITDQ
jgi:hypothetical protein